MTGTKARSTPMSVAASATSTPAPPTLAEQLSIVSLPRPYKAPEFSARMARISSNLSRRNKSLKQILITEREAGLRSSGLGLGRRKAAPANKAARLTGAAAKAFARREQRERKLRLEIDTPDHAPSPTPAPPTPVLDDETEANTAEQTPAPEPEPEPEPEPQHPAKPKRYVPTYASVEAPPSLRPRKKYCDVTGLIAPYTDPKSRLRYHSVEVYEIIKQFGPGVDNAYLSLRGDATEIK